MKTPAVTTFQPQVRQNNSRFPYKNRDQRTQSLLTESSLRQHIPIFANVLNALEPYYASQRRRTAKPVKHQIKKDPAISLAVKRNRSTSSRPKYEKRAAPKKTKTTDFLKELVQRHSEVTVFVNKKSAIVSYVCSEDVANEVFIRDLNEEIKEKYGLWCLEYSEGAFYMELDDSEALYHACNELSERIATLSQPVPDEVPKRYGKLTLEKFSKRLKFKGEKECTFCMNMFRIGEKVLKTSCLHIFHKECMTKWLEIKNVCPIDKVLFE